MQNASEIALENTLVSALENASEEAATGERAFGETAFEATGGLETYGTYATYGTFVMMVTGVIEAYGMPLRTSCPPRD